MTKRYRVKVFTFANGWTVRLHSVSREVATMAADQWAEVYGTMNVVVSEND